MYTVLKGRSGSVETDHQTLAAAMQEMRRSKLPCRIECEARGHCEWEKWYVRTVEGSHFQYVSPDGEVICSNEEFDMLIEKAKESLVDGINVN